MVILWLAQVYRNQANLQLLAIASFTPYFIVLDKCRLISFLFAFGGRHTAHDRYLIHVKDILTQTGKRPVGILY